MLPHASLSQQAECSRNGRTQASPPDLGVPFQEVGQMLGQIIFQLSLCCSALLGGVKLDVILSKAIRSSQP